MERDPGVAVLLDGLTFPEGPRWHEGRLWFSDFYSHRVIAVDQSAATKDAPLRVRRSAAALTVISSG